MTLAGLAALATAGGAVLAGGGDATLKVVGIAVEGNAVRITVQNLGEEAAGGTLMVRAAVSGRELTVMRDITISGGNKDFVEIVFPRPVDGIIQAGVILDDGAPF